MVDSSTGLATKTVALLLQFVKELPFGTAKSFLAEKERINISVMQFLLLRRVGRSTKPLCLSVLRVERQTSCLKLATDAIAIMSFYAFLCALSLSF